MCLVCFNMFLYRKGSQRPKVGRNVESSKNVKHKTGIHPQALMSHFKPIINLKNSQMPKQIKTLATFVLPYFCPIDPVFGP